MNPHEIANDAHRLILKSLHHANSSTSSANFGAKITVVEHHCTDGDPKTTVLSCPVN